MKKFYSLMGLLSLTIGLGLSGEQAACKVPGMKETFGVWPTTFLFAHGLGGSGRNAEWYAKSSKSDWYIMDCPYHTFDFPDVGKGKGKIKREQVNVGQTADIQALVDESEKILSGPDFADPKQGIVVIGDSRGGITALNAAGQGKLARVRALVAIAPVDTAMNAFDHQLERYYLNWDPVTRATYELVSKFWYTSHDTAGISPIEAIKGIDPELAICLVHAEDDLFTSVNCSRVLYYELLLHGHNPHKLFLLELPHGKHGKYNVSDPVSARIFQAAIHAFYSWFHIPYDADLADEGEQYLVKSQPSLVEIEAILKKSAKRYFKQSLKRQQQKDEL